MTRHADAVNSRVATGTPVLPLQLPVAAVEWSCHAETTIKDAAGEVLAECGGHGRQSAEDVLIAGEFVLRVNAHDALVAAAKKAHEFIFGFFDDETQEPTITELLTELEAAITEAGGSTS